MSRTQNFKSERTILVTLLAIAITAAGQAWAQKSTAKAGYYPDCYHGDVFSGTLTAADDNKGEITLTYTGPKHNKMQTLVGEIEQGYTVRSHTQPAPHQLRASELPLGKTLTAYYCILSKKVNGKKTTTNSIFFIEGVPNLAKRQMDFMFF